MSPHCCQIQLGAHSKMICIKTQHFNLNRMLLLSIGLWPYQRSKLVTLQVICILVILISFVIFQLTTFMTVKYTFKLVIKILSSALFFFMFVIEYSYFWAKGQTIRYLIEQLQRICNELTDENEIAIIKKYGSRGQFYTAVLMWSCAGTIFALLSAPIWPHILDIVMSANESKTRRTTQIVTEYFVDPDRYFYLILLHMNASCCIGTAVVLATGTMFIAYIQHTCGMFKIASYRIKRALPNDISRKISLRNEVTIRKEIIHAIDIHRKAMMLSEFLTSNFEGLFICLVLLGVICLSCNLFRIFQVVSFSGNTEEFLLHLVYVTDILLYMLLTNYFGQEVTDYNNDVFVTVYNVRWYVTSLSTQKNILLMLQRSNKAFFLNVGGLITGSLESFSTVGSLLCLMILGMQR